MNTETLDKLAPAMVKVQAEIKAAKKTHENPFFHSTYADLQDVCDACRDSLTKNGFSILQFGSYLDGHQFITTCLLHSSGQSMMGLYLVKPAKDDPQGLGAAWTYARRYSLAAMVGVVTEDDDGEGAMHREKTAQPARTTSTTAQTSAPAPKAKPAIGGDVIEVEVKPIKFGSKKGGTTEKPWTRYYASWDGEWISTFDHDLGALLQAICDEGGKARFKLKKSEKGCDILGIEEADVKSL